MAHVAGSLVLMADYSWKSNADICVGEQVLGADLIPSTVVKTSFVIVGHFRRMLSFIERPQLQFTESASLWARDSERQWWWVENVFTLQLLWKSYKIAGGLKKIDSHLVSYDVEFATLNGFEKLTPVDITESYHPDTRLPFIVTDRRAPVIINGHVVSSELNEYTYDYTTFDWTSSLEQLKQTNRKIQCIL
jgi:hypothetical protein